MAKLKVGDKMPDFKFLNPYKEGEDSFSNHSKDKKTVILFLRYIGCNVCQLDMHLYAKRYSELTALNANLITVLQSDPNIVKQEAEEGTFPFVVACDPTLQLYKDFEIDPAKNMLQLVGGGIFSALKKMSASRKFGFTHGAYEGIEEQLPAMFITDENGTLTFAHYSKNLTDLPSIDEVINKVR